MSMLSVENIRLSYQTVAGETHAIKDISFSVEEGEFIGIVGPSGCGKSTLLSCIAGLTQPTGGRVVLDGKNVDGVSENIGYMLQTDNLLPWRSIYRNVLLGLEIQKKLNEETKAYAAELLKKYDLWDFRDSYPSALSGGMRQRVSLIRTLAVKPRLLLLDEAFSALDYQTRMNVSRDVYRILRSENKTMLMVTHDIPEAVSMSDRVMVLSQRPAVIASVVKCDFGRRRDPVAVRNNPRFQLYFDKVWKEMSR
ncbi:MAG: ABC transporter ATP-binding protein [Oscillospiraceae bacterium]|nr:ABC transporter ATP-binding protein [Oscillospiraceae bacterium]